MSLYLTQLKASLFSKQCVLPYNKGTGNDAVYLSWQGCIRKQESLEKQLEKNYDCCMLCVFGLLCQVIRPGDGCKLGVTAVEMQSLTGKEEMCSNY